MLTLIKRCREAPQRERSTAAYSLGRVTRYSAVTAKQAAAARTTVAPVAVSRYQETTIPANPESAATPTETQRAEAAPRATLRAAAAGMTSRAVTSRIPTVWIAAVTTRATTSAKEI